MKLMSIILSLFSMSAFADVALDCKNINNIGFDFTLKAEALQGEWYSDGTARLVNTIATAQQQDNGADEKEVGRAKYLQSVSNERARKYVDYYKFDLSQLVNTESFGSYLPVDLCTINLMIPKSILKDTKAQPVAVVHCDQGGGTIRLACKVTKIKN